MSEQGLLDLGGQNAFVTGAGQGAGRGIALMLARHGAGGVAVNDYVLDRAEAVAAEITALGVKAVPVQADVGDHASVQAAFDRATDALGPITLLVNNAGNAGPDAQMRHSPLFWETQPDEWSRYFRTNLDGVMNCCHVAIPAMVAQKRGRIVTITSDSGRVGEARLAAYAAAKAGAAGFVRSIAKEAARFGITCNAISLSTLEPPMEPEQLEAFLASDRTKAQLANYTIRRFGKPDDVAAMALFLCSDASSWITGQTYPVNGGYSFAV
ncbi:SDR family oxidoreductase [Sphingobium sufflavum]|uniref:SDR family NAD(P)-dependent oxidoreductase n=1 Tax=Sphingobium sufflavum TaxID=1129547 RepID=UPI001F29135E|nr:SDR family NAD(P)-dependent oxidoreductase [Sphingobium sufflavum]MCE7796925.1 SDR family oxidoreductase [Sphingobium sufflavum]